VRLFEPTNQLISLRIPFPEWGVGSSFHQPC
jgi:hypothetical protein